MCLVNVVHRVHRVNVVRRVPVVHHVNVSINVFAIKKKNNKVFGLKTSHNVYYVSGQVRHLIQIPKYKHGPNPLTPTKTTL